MLVSRRMTFWITALHPGKPKVTAFTDEALLWYDSMTAQVTGATERATWCGSLHLKATLDLMAQFIPDDFPKAATPKS